MREAFFLPEKATAMVWELPGLMSAAPAAMRNPTLFQAADTDGARLTEGYSIRRGPGPINGTAITTWIWA